MENRLEIAEKEFRSGMQRFKGRLRASQALLSFEGGFLSIECDDRTVVMRAEGDWQVRATFGSSVLSALSATRFNDDPVKIELRGDRLRIGTLEVTCHAEQVSKAFIRSATDPDYITLLALERTLPRSEVNQPSLKRRIGIARTTIAGRVEKAAKLLAPAGISADEIWELVEDKIRGRLSTTS